ncbi:uncharacterized protein LOC119688239 [Teleopsis dalmanni]|uniref:uncharacterized protein LOC119688239 n=1 Tax=Teleopsis dalmanni TaxID=139649 RepID=UPI0018CD7EDE|nr:uncharacterized protein LOC119688239 [Teleopsis dalmanni]
MSNEVEDSNADAELQNKCAENGMKTSPVTDASRGRLTKKWRAIFSGTMPDTPTNRNKRYYKAPTDADKIEGDTKKREDSAQKVLPVTVTDIKPIESSDEEAEAADRDVPVRERTTRSVSVTKSYIPVPVVAAAKKDVDTIIEEQSQVEPAVRQRSTVSFDEEPIMSFAPVSHHIDIYSKFEKKQFDTTKAKQYPVGDFKTSQLVTPTTGYGSKYASPLSLGTAYLLDGTPSLLSGKTNAYYNEQSDDTDSYDRPFLSNFARTLDRLKSSHVHHISGDKYSGGPRPRKLMVHEKRRRPSIIEPRVERFTAIDRKYLIRRNLLITLIALTFIVFIYRQL